MMSSRPLVTDTIRHRLAPPIRPSQWLLLAPEAIRSL